MTLTGRTTTATECTCRPHTATARSPTRTSLAASPPPLLTATPTSRSASKLKPTTSISTPPHGGLPAGGTSSVAPPIPGCETTLQQTGPLVHASFHQAWSMHVNECSCVDLKTRPDSVGRLCENNNADKHESQFVCSKPIKRNFNQTLKPRTS